MLQTEAAECGLACLAMVVDHHGYRTDLASLRRRFPGSLKGASLTTLVGVAQALGFQARALRLELDELPQLQLPCLLHWNLDHYVVLRKVGRKSVTIVDPVSGERRIALAEVSRHFTGVALEVEPGLDFRPRPAPPAVRLSQLTGRVRGLWSSLAQLLGLSLALQVFVLLAPFLMQWVVDQALVSADRDLLTVLCLGFGLALALQLAIGWLRGWSVVFLASRLNLQWVVNVFAHAMRLPLDYFQKRHLGDIVSRLSSVQAIQRTLTTGFVEALIDGLMAVATLSMMLIYSPRLACVSLVAVGLYLALRAIAFLPLRNATEGSLAAGARQQSHLLESLRGVQCIKLAGQEGFRQATYQNLMVDSVNQEVRLARLNLGFSTTGQAVFGFERIVVIWVGAGMAMESVFSVGMLIAYLAYKDQFAARVVALIDRGVEFRMLRLHGERLADVVLTPPEADPGSEGEPPPLVEARIEVEGLGFRYAEGEPWVLKDCSFTVQPGESVAITGASGCGKTTLLKLMLGLIEPTEGAIRVGGHDLRRFGLSNFRAITGAVMQDDPLFAGSVADNIALGAAIVDMGRVEAMARLAAVHDDIAAMPMGYHSMVGDMGTTLSGGQKQRVLLARALYRGPRLLFLDEATSHLDVAREQVVNEAVRQLDLTRVIIAHRPETIASAGRVLEMQGGRVVELQRPEAARHRAGESLQAGAGGPTAGVEAARSPA